MGRAMTKRTGLSRSRGMITDLRCFSSRSRARSASFSTQPLAKEAHEKQSRVRFWWMIPPATPHVRAEVETSIVSQPREGEGW